MRPVVVCPIMNLWMAKPPRTRARMPHITRSGPFFSAMENAFRVMEFGTGLQRFRDLVARSPPLRIGSKMPVENATNNQVGDAWRYSVALGSLFMLSTSHGIQQIGVQTKISTMKTMRPV